MSYNFALGSRLPLTSRPICSASPIVEPSTGVMNICSKMRFKARLIFALINLVVLVDGIFSSESYFVESSICRRARIVDYHDGYSCDVITIDPSTGTLLGPETYDAVPRNASAVRLTYRRRPVPSRRRIDDGPLPVIPSLPALHILELDVGEERSIGGGIFSNLTNVEQLYVFRASSSAVAVANDFSLDLPSSTESTSSAPTSLISIASTFAGLTSLSTLVLSDLGIVSIPDSGFVGLRSLRILYLNNNQLTVLRSASVATADYQFTSGSLFGDCVRLTSLSIARNRISSLGDVSFAGLERLRSLDLHGNRIARLDADDLHASSLFQLVEIVEMNLSGNGLMAIRSGTFIAGPRSLRTLYIDANRLTEVEPGTFDGLEMLSSLDVSSNRVSVIKRGAFRGLRSLETLTMRANGLTVIDRRVWQGLSQLHSLDLSNNRMSQVDADTFNGLTSIEYLDLSDNLLRVLSSSSFSHLANLTYLSLANNRLRTVDGPFRLPYPTSPLMVSLHLDLSENAWQCDDCGVRRLATWLRDALTGNSATVATGLVASFKLQLDNVGRTQCISDGLPLVSASANNSDECLSPRPEVTSTSVVMTTANKSDAIGTVAMAGSAAAIFRSTLTVIHATTVPVSTTLEPPEEFLFQTVGIVAAVCLALIVTGVTWCSCVVTRRRRRRWNADARGVRQSRRPTWCSTSTTNDDDLEADTGNSSATATLSRSSQRLHLADSLGALVNLPSGSYSPHRAEKHRQYHHVHHQYYNDHVTEESLAGTYTMRHSVCTT